MKKLENGVCKYNEIKDELKIDMDRLSMLNTWKLHRDNPRKLNKLNDFYMKYLYNLTCADDLELIINQIFDEQLEMISNNSNNPFLLVAKDDFDKKKEKELEKQFLIEEREKILIKQHGPNLFSGKSPKLNEEERRIIIEKISTKFNNDNLNLNGVKQKSLLDNYKM